MHVIFIIGPYRDATISGVVQNIRRAEAAAINVWQFGAAALCPHKNSALLDGMATDERFLAGGKEMLRRCDACYLVEGWRDSAGSLAEMKVAEQAGIPIAATLDELRLILADLEDGR